MRQMMKQILREIAPPFVTRAARRLKRRRPEPEKGPEWYDASFEQYEDWRLHYCESHYYFLWTVIVDRIVRSRVQRILDIGCGPGQLSSLIRDKGVPEYHGFDFSPKRVEQARQVCPEFEFSVANAYDTDLFETYPYDAVVCTEFLEHVDRDLDVLDRIRPGAHVLATVPNFPGDSHVRHFGAADEVAARYQSRFSGFTVDSFIATTKGKTFYLFEGTKN